VRAGFAAARFAGRAALFFFATAFFLAAFFFMNHRQRVCVSTSVVPGGLGYISHATQRFRAGLL
jgi:hypothetical protein